MTSKPTTQIEPGALLGVLGGGQLGAMFVAAAHRLGYGVAVWDPDAQAPAHFGADRSITRPFSSADGLADFIDGLAAVTYEWENVPASLCEQLERRIPLRPASHVLRTIQHRGVQKRFLAERGFPVAPFREIRAAHELDRAAMVGFPCLLKTATSGYDGKGQWRLDHAGEIGGLQAMLPAQPTEGRAWIVEALVPFVRELSVVVVRDQDERCASYPAADNRHERGILRRTTVPAPLDECLAERTRQLSEDVVAALGSAGVFCVELFLLPDGSLLVNEVAPRPHNSGHYTLDACTVSQFEQQVRVLCGLPIGEVRLTSPAVMVNLLGQDVLAVTQGSGLQAVLGQPGVHLHVYRKREVRPGRKMGHITVTSDTREAAEGLADDILKTIEASVTS